MGGLKNPLANMRSREGGRQPHVMPPTRCTGVRFLSVFFVSVYTRSLLGSFGAFSATLWRPMGQSPSKTKVLPTWNPVHRLMLSTHHLVRTHVPPLCLTPCPSFPGGIAAYAARPLPPLPPRGVGFVHVPPAQETMGWGSGGGGHARS